MLGHTHVVIAGVTWAAVWWRPVILPGGAALLDAPMVSLGALLPAPISTLVAVAFGALLPDFDHPGALLARWQPAGKGGFLGWRRLIRPLFFPSLAVRDALGHRGALHSIAAGVGLCFLIEVFGQQGGTPGAGAAIGWGYAFHLLADLLTRRGVPLLWPLTKRRVALPRALTVKTGGFGETMYLAAFSALAGLHAAGAFGLLSGVVP